MIQKSTILHLRIPFSVFLLPFFLFALALTPNPDNSNVILSFIIFYVLVFPASNGFNSYYDKDKGSIGGLENPPPVRKELLYVSLGLDVLALLLSLFVSIPFAVMVLIYGIMSKLYSHPFVRFKKYPIIGLWVVSIFQGAWTFYMCLLAFGATISDAQYWMPALICTLILLGSYPMTQIYQHEEDAERGDRTFSLLLGIQGTFLWTALVFMSASILFFFYFYTIGQISYFYYLLFFLTPVLVYFFFWFYISKKNVKAVNYKNTMRLNLLSSTSFILFFIFLYIKLH